MGNLNLGLGKGDQDAMPRPLPGPTPGTGIFLLGSPFRGAGSPAPYCVAGLVFVAWAGEVVTGRDMGVLRKGLSMGDLVSRLGTTLSRR